MGKITAELLRAMVPRTKGQMIDKLIDPLNLVLPAYGITTEYRVAGFLATAAPESDWFKTLREYGKGKGRKYGTPDKITGLVYYGRGIFQNTWKRGYQAFTEYVEKHWDSIKGRASAYGFQQPPDFVALPELLATPYWAVEAACWYWKVNGLATYADRGLKGFFGLQGLVNRGNANKEALDYYEARLPAYEKARKLIPDDFSLNSAATSMPAPLTTANDKQDTLVPDPADSQVTQPEPPPTVIAGATDTAVSTQTTTTETTGTPPGDTVQTTTTTSEAPPVAVTPAKPTLQATAIAFLTMIYGWYKMAKEDFGNLVDRATDAIDLHMAINLGVGLSLVILGVWMHQRSRQRAAEITQSLIKTAADQQSNTVTLVSRSHWWSKWI